jgi:hypothetical protein
LTRLVYADAVSVAGMSITAFYHHKAAQCERLAAEATEPTKCVNLKEEGALWREIARDIAKQERAEGSLP